MIKITDSNVFKKVADSIKYFDMDGKSCRALPFDKDLLGTNRNQTNKNSVFIKGLDKDIKSKDLEAIFAEKVGPVKSAKVSINADYSVRGYGFVCFTNPEDAKKAIALKGELGFETVLPYNPKDRREVRKLFNNIYVKNFPPEWDEEELKKWFGKFGTIKSLFKSQKARAPDAVESPFAFICYEDPNDKEYGPKCAMAAIQELHDFEVAPGFKIYVKEALKKADREMEKKKDQMRFKNSKKRCNLYVKNFPPNTTEA